MWMRAVAIVLLGCGAVPAEGQTVRVERVGDGVVSTDRNETFPAQDPVTGALWFSVYEGSFSDQSIKTPIGVDPGGDVIFWNHDVTSGTFLIASESRLRAALEQW